jgi:hypothetical protein
LLHETRCLIVFGLLVAASGASAQTPAEIIARAVLAAPANAREGAMVIKWKPDYTYDTLRPGTNRLVCFDRSGEPGEVAFAVQCTSVGNLDGSHRTEVRGQRDSAKRQAALAADRTHQGEAGYGSVFSLNGADQATARLHVTIAVPGATTATIGLPDNNKMGGAWIMNAGTTTAHIMTPGS